MSHSTKLPFFLLIPACNLCDILVCHPGTVFLLTTCTMFLCTIFLFVTLWCTLWLWIPSSHHPAAQSLLCIPNQTNLIFLLNLIAHSQPTISISWSWSTWSGIWLLLDKSFMLVCGQFGFGCQWLFFGHGCPGSWWRSGHQLAAQALSGWSLG